MSPACLPRVAEILAILDSGQDSPTGASFKVGPNGRLTSTPTRRIALLEELAQLDPAAAAAASAKILQSFTQPDEWAVCLRNCARADDSPAMRAFVEQKLREMLAHEAWRRDPSVGFLEAFDAVVHIGGTNLMPVMTEFLRQREDSERAVAHAAFLTLDRLVINDPVSTLRYLEADPAAMSGREVTRANYFARADVTDPQQRALVESYLLGQNRTPAELHAFAGLFPNFNLMISDNLLTRSATVDGATIAQRDRAALQTVEQWLADPRFASLRQHLNVMKGRLEQFTKGSARQ